MAIPAQLAEALRDRYVLERELGRGGMANVYLARDLKHDRPVALKVLRDELAATLGPDRFRREIHLAARLQHPHILPVHDSGEANGQLWFTMPYVDGESLRGRMARERQLPVDVALRIAREAAQALQYAHAHGVIHRDIKPENLLLTADGSTVIADFGIARPLDTQANDRLTGTGLALGTPAYMSPEQASCDSDIDGRTDIYSLACVLYEMLAGAPPYTGPTAQAVIVKRFTDPAPSVRRIRLAVPPAIERAILKAMARAPGDRFPSAAAFAEALVAAAELPEPTPSVAVLPFLSLSPDPADEFFADGITEDVIAQLSKIRSLKVISRASAMQFKRRGQSLREIASRLDVTTLLDGSVRHAGDRVRIVAQLVDPETDRHLWTETYDRRLTDIFQIQTDVALQIAGALRAELSPDERSRIRREPTSDVHAYQLYLQGRYCFSRYTEEGLRKSIEYFTQATAADPDYALAYVGIARAYAELTTGQGSTLRPEVAIARAKAAAARAVSLDARLGDARAVLGLLKFAYEFDWNGAERELKLALELNPGSADIYDYYGWLCWALDRNDEALTHVRRAQELDPLAHVLDVATTLLRLGRYEEARQEAERSIEFNPSIARGHSTLGWACLKLGQVDRGLAEMEEAIRLAPGDTLFIGQLGQAYAVAGQPARARQVLQQLDELSRERYVAPYHFAYVYAGLGEAERAMDYVERAYEERAGGVYGVKGSFLFTTLRSHPRFRALLQRMNLA